MAFIRNVLILCLILCVNCQQFLYPPSYGLPYPYSVPYGMPESNPYPNYPYPAQQPMYAAPYPYGYSQPQPYPYQPEGYYTMPQQQPPLQPQLQPSQSVAAGPQFVSTPYGNIPVEIIDVDGPPSYPNTPYGYPFPAVNPMPYPSLNNYPIEFEDVESNETEVKPLIASVSHKNSEVPVKPILTSSIVESKPMQTTIRRTLDSKTGDLLDMKVESNKVIEKTTPEKTTLPNSGEDFETTTRAKSFSLFG